MVMSSIVVKVRVSFKLFWRALSVKKNIPSYKHSENFPPEKSSSCLRKMDFLSQGFPVFPNVRYQFSTMHLFRTGERFQVSSLNHKVYTVPKFSQLRPT